MILANLWVLLVILAFGCTASPNKNIEKGKIVNYTRCALSPDQGEGSLLAPWSNLSVPVVFDRDFYVTDGGEIVPSLKAALETWNGWARGRGLTAFSLREDGSGAGGGRNIPELTDCTIKAYSSSVTDVVGIWKIGTHGFSKNARESCGRNSNNVLNKILPDGVQGQTDWTVVDGRITGASILLNFEGYNAPGKELLDVESLLLHELGHVLGLLHSCQGDSSDTTSSPLCSASPARYINAVMFPFLDGNEERRDLKQNDYDRINCLY